MPNLSHIPVDLQPVYWQMRLERIFKDWICEQANSYGICIPADDWDHYDTNLLSEKILDLLEEMNYEKTNRMDNRRTSAT